MENEYSTGGRNTFRGEFTTGERNTFIGSLFSLGGSILFLIGSIILVYAAYEKYQSVSTQQ